MPRLFSKGNIMRDFAKISEVTVGSILIPDDDFTCCKAGDELEIFKDENGLYFKCDEGHHSLDGQEKDDYYNGLYLKK